MLPEADRVYLSERSIPHEAKAEGGMICLVLPDYALPTGYNVARSNLLLRLSAGYPDVAPDMWWFDPPLRLASGGTIQATECMEPYLGRQWQRWSRHFPPGQWRSGVDSLESFLALIRKELERCALQPVR